MRRFIPYFGRYKGVLVFDLFCASLTTVCELVFPMLLRYITNQGMQDLASLSVGVILRIGGIYFALRVVDGLAADRFRVAVPLCHTAGVRTELLLPIVRGAHQLGPTLEAQLSSPFGFLPVPDSHRWHRYPPGERCSPGGS